MAKQLSSIQVVISGTAADGPTSVCIQYTVQDSGDAELKKTKTKYLETPALSRKMHDEGATGEFWKDEVAAIKSSEGIS